MGNLNLLFFPHFGLSWNELAGVGYAWVIADTAQDTANMLPMLKSYKFSLDLIGSVAVKYRFSIIIPLSTADYFKRNTYGFIQKAMGCSENNRLLFSVTGS